MFRIQLSQLGAMVQPLRFEEAVFLFSQLGGLPHDYGSGMVTFHVKSV